MSRHGWRLSLLQGIGTRIDALAEQYPGVYLLLVTLVALTGFAMLLLFPLLALAGMTGMYQSLVGGPDIAWLQTLVWMLVTGFGALVTYRLVLFRPPLPAGVVLKQEQAPDLFGLAEDTAEQYAYHGVDRIVITSGYQLDIIRTHRTGFPVCSTGSLVIGLSLMQCLSSQQFVCLLARRLGQFSKRANPLLNRLFELRDVWPVYCQSRVKADPALLPLYLLFSVYTPLYSVVSAAAARLDELQADSYAMEISSDEEVMEAITTDTVYRLFLREKYWPVIRKLF